MHLLAWGFLMWHQQQEAPSDGATVVHGLVGHFFCAFNSCVRTCWSGLPLAQTFAKSTFSKQDFIVVYIYSLVHMSDAALIQRNPWFSLQICLYKPLATLLTMKKINNKEQESSQQASQMPSLTTSELFVF